MSRPATSPGRKVSGHRSVLPAVVHPDPLLGMFPDPFLYQGGAPVGHPPDLFRIGIVLRRTVGIAEWRSEADPVPGAGDPDGEGRKKGKPKPEGDPGRSWMGSSHPPEKGGEEPFGRGRALVHGHDDDPVRLQRLQDGADSVILRRKGDCFSMAPPVLPDEGVDLGVSDLSRNHVDRRRDFEGKSLADELPVPEMGDEGQNPLPLREQVPDAVHALELDLVPEPAFGKGGEPEKFCPEFSVVAEDIPLERPDFQRSRKLGKGQFEIF